MFFCDSHLKNEGSESESKYAKETKAKKKHGRSHANRGLLQNQVTGAGLNTASWLCNPH